MPVPSLHSSIASDTPDYISRLKLLLHEHNYRHNPNPPSPIPGFCDTFHEWIQTILGPALPFSTAQLRNVEEVSSGVSQHFYSFADLEMQLLMAKLIAIIVVFDDSLDDDEMHAEMARFTQRVYLGTPQPPGLLAIYHELIKELSSMYEGDAVLMGLAVVPWITFVDGSLMEKRLLTVDVTLRASPLDMGYDDLSTQRQVHVKHSGTNGKNRNIPIQMNGDSMEFPCYLRQKTGAGEAFVAPVFRANRMQRLPLTRYIQALPDLQFWTNAMNDVLSFHKEQLDGETFTYIHLRNQALSSAPTRRKGSGQHGEWTLNDTFNLVCDEVRDAARRIDRMLGVEEVVKRRQDTNCTMDVSMAMDEAMAMQWRDFRDGYIRFHLESDRYKLDFLKHSRSWKGVFT